MFFTRHNSALIVLSLCLFTSGCTSLPGESNSITAEKQEDTTGSLSEQLPDVSLDDLDQNFVRKVAFNEVKNSLLSSSMGPDKVKHVIVDGVNQDLVNLAIAQIPTMAGFFGDLPPVKKYTIIWTVSGGGVNLGDLVCEEAGYCGETNPERFCNVGELRYLWVFCETNTEDKNQYLYPIWHGYGHVQQYAVAGNAYMPSWFGEGVASYFEGHFSGLYLYGDSYSTFGNSLYFLKQLLYDNQSIVEVDFPATEQNVIDVLLASADQSAQFDGWERAQLGYYLGFIAVEALIAAEGLEKFKHFWRMTGSKNFDAAFEDVYALSSEEFFKKLAPYAVKMMKNGG